MPFDIIGFVKKHEARRGRPAGRDVIGLIGVRGVAGAALEARTGTTMSVMCTGASSSEPQAVAPVQTASVSPALEL